MKNKVTYYVERGIPWDEQTLIARECGGVVEINSVYNNRKCLLTYVGWIVGEPIWWFNRQAISTDVARYYWQYIIPPQ